MEEGIFFDVERGVAAADEVDPWPADAHDSREGDLFLRAERVIVDGGFEVLRLSEYFRVADGVGAGDVVAGIAQQGLFAVD